MRNQNLFALDGLADLGARTGADMRPTLLRVLTDLYVHRLSHTAEEERLYTELALRLLDDVDVATRVAVAKRFARYLSPPLRILQRLSRDVPDVAAELRAHPLMQPAGSAGAAAHRAAVEAAAKREEVAPPVPRAARVRALDRASASELTDSFFDASVAERRLILLNLHVVAPVAAGSVPILRETAIIQKLEAAALGGNRTVFVQELARALHIPREQATRIARDEYGEPVVAAAKALGMPRHVLYRILMFINPSIGHSVQRVHALAALYDEMTLPAAEGMVAIWQALVPRERAAPAYRPLAYDDEARRHARPGVAAGQRTPVAPRTIERRNAS